MSSPTVRSLKLLRDEGWVCGVVECYNSFTKRRHDYLGVIDIICVPGPEQDFITPKDHALAVQTTSYSNVSSRVRKIQESEAYPAMLAAQWKIEVHGWHKRKGRWQVRRVYL